MSSERKRIKTTRMRTVRATIVLRNLMVTTMMINKSTDKSSNHLKSFDDFKTYQSINK